MRTCVIASGANYSVRRDVSMKPSRNWNGWSAIFRKRTRRRISRSPWPINRQATRSKPTRPWRKADGSSRLMRCCANSGCDSGTPDRNLRLTESPDRNCDAGRGCRVRGREHVAASVENAAGVDYQTRRVNFAGDNAFGLDLHPPLGENHAVVAACDHNSISLDLAFDLGILPEDQGLLRNDITFDVTIDAERSSNLQCAFKRHTLVDK